MRKRDRARSGSVVWLTSFDYPKAQVMPLGAALEISIFKEKEKPGFAFSVDRRFARMLARRINEALDGSK